MSIKKLIEFATTGDKNTDELDLERGFPSRIYPARQWFNWLFNSLTVKINEIIETKVDKSDISEITQIEADQGTNTVSKLISAKVLKNAISQHVPINNTLTSTSTSQALSAAQGQVLANRDLGWGQTYNVLTGSRVIGTTYTNTTGKPIYVNISVADGGVGTEASINFYVNGVLAHYLGDVGEFDHAFSVIVPPSSTYMLSTGNPIKYWGELS